MKVLLRAKHWHLFLVIVAMPVGFEAVLSGPDSVLRMMDLAPFPPLALALPMMWMSLGLFAWLWAVGTWLGRRLPSSLALDVRRFHVFLITPLAYITGIGLFLSAMVKGADGFPLWLLLVIPLHLFSLFCMIYTIYFVARAWKTTELQQPLKLDTYFGELILIWFFPMGIWFIQPRINRLFAAAV